MIDFRLGMLNQFSGTAVGEADARAGRGQAFQFLRLAVRTRTRVLAVFLVATLGICASRAQPVPKINSVFPAWLQRGASTQVTLYGENLGEVSGFIFTGSGLSAMKVPADKPAVTLETSAGGIVPGGEDENKVLRIKIAVPADASLGPREIRAKSPSGVSNPLSLNINWLPEITETGPNNATNQAQWVQLPVGISGHIGAPAQVDYFRFKAEKGKRLIFDVDAFRSGSPLDSSLAILDASGKELARNEDYNSFDSLIDFAVPYDGEYLIQLRDFRYQGGGDYRYHLVAGDVPYLDALFPFGAQRGQQVEISLQGRNLDGASTMKLKIEPDAPLGRQDVRAHTGRGHTNPRPFVIGDLPEFIEQEPNNSTNEANTVSLPVVINGRIGEPKDVDTFKFKVEKGQRFIFEVSASRFGSALDALLTLSSPSGAIMQRNDDADGADSRLEQTFDEAGDYTVSIRDLLGRGGDNFGYRLSIRTPPGPNFSAKFLPDTIQVSRGGHSLLRVEVNRRQGFGGPIEVVAAKLPMGVSSETLVIPADLSSGFLTLSANENAALGTAPLKVSAKAVMNGKLATRTAQASGNSRENNEGFLTVRDTPPFTVSFLSLGAEVEQEQSTTVEAVIQRGNGFDGAVTVSLEGFSSDRESISRSVSVDSVTLKPGETHATFRLQAKLDSEIGSRPIFVKGEANVAGQTIDQYSRTIPLTIREFPFTLSTTLPRLTLTAIPQGTKSAAGEAEFGVKVSRRGLFTEEIALAIEGLPDGIVATSTNLPRSVSEATFKLTATEKAAVGKTNTFKILGTSDVNGRRLQQRTSAITLVVNAPGEGPALAGDNKSDKK